MGSNTARFDKAYTDDATYGAEWLYSKAYVRKKMP